VNREAELETPSRVACSDLLEIVFPFQLRFGLTMTTTNLGPNPNHDRQQRRTAVKPKPKRIP
jgi:hypothetical protein